VSFLRLFNPGDTDLAQLPITDVAGELTIGVEFGRTSLAGLAGIVHVGSLTLDGSTLTSVDGMDGLTTIDGDFTIEGNMPALHVIDGFPALTALGGIQLESEDLVTLRLPALTTINNHSNFTDNVSGEFNISLIEMSFPSLQTFA